MAGLDISMLSDDSSVSEDLKLFVLVLLAALPSEVSKEALLGWMREIIDAQKAYLPNNMVTAKVKTYILDLINLVNGDEN